MLAWSAWIPLFRMPWLPRPIAFVGLFAPALAAVSTAAFFEGAGGVREIFRRLTMVRFPVLWVVLPALIMPAIYVGALGALRVMKPGGTGGLLAGSSPLFVAAGFAWLLFVTAGEELGWRGYALPRLLERFGHPVAVSLGLGLVWGIWHLPMYLLPGQSAFPLPLFLLFTSLQSVLYMALFAGTRGSLWPALLLHAGTDIAPRVFQLVRLPATFWVLVDGMLALVVAAVLMAMRHRLGSMEGWGDAATNRRQSAT